MKCCLPERLELVFVVAGLAAKAPPAFSVVNAAVVAENRLVFACDPVLALRREQKAE